MSDLADIQEAIEDSNRAFEEFKKNNDTQIELLKKGEHDPADLKAKLDAITTSMAENKATIETLEAKLKRPLVGGDGKPVDQAAEDHRKAFKGYMTRGDKYDESGMQYSAGLSIKSLSASSGPDGGFAIPKVIDGMIESLIVNVSPIRGISQVVQISTQDYHKLVNMHGSSLSGWVGEKSARTATGTPQFADVAPAMGEIYANPQATQQMLDDVFFNAEQWLADELALEFARAEGAAFISGTGVNQPMGFLSGPAPVTTADATRAFGTLQYNGTGSSGAWRTVSGTVNPVDDLIVLASNLKAGYRQGARFVMNKATLFSTMGLKDYQGRYVYNPVTAPGVEDTILGYPITEAEDMPTYSTASAYAIAFGNFHRGYLIADRIGTRVIRDPFSNKPYVGFYTTKRLGGCVLNSEAIKLLKFA